MNEYERTHKRGVPAGMFMVGKGRKKGRKEEKKKRNEKKRDEVYEINEMNDVYV